MSNIEYKVLKLKGYICAEKQQLIRLFYQIGLIDEKTCEIMATKNIMSFINNDVRKYCELNNLDIKKVLESE